MFRPFNLKGRCQVKNPQNHDQDSTLLNENRRLKRRVREQKATIKKLRAERDQALAKTYTDFLTGLLTREPLQTMLERELREENGRRRKFGTPQSVAVLALDAVGFKHVNDTVGHDAGDIVLTEIADALRRSIRSKNGRDLAERSAIGRSGGDEFHAVLPNVTAETVQIVVNRILAAVREIGNGIDIRIGGVVWNRSSDDPPTAKDLLRAADLNERALKKAGAVGSRITIYGHNQ